jgi:hypothetical protein
MKRDSIKDNVVLLLKEDERCRNDDKWLTWRFYHDVMGIKMFIPFDDFERMPSFESIRRVRQKIQNGEGMYPPSEGTRKKRTEGEKSWRIWSKQ